MRRRTVILAPEAIEDLRRVYDWIAERTNEFLAKGYVDRIETFCRGFDLASERGHKRNDIRPGLRIAGFERRVTIAFVIDAGLGGGDSSHRSQSGDTVCRKSAAIVDQMR